MCFLLFWFKVEGQLKFIPNAGQWKGDFQFKSEAIGSDLFVDANALVYNFRDEKTLAALHHKPFLDTIVGAQAVRVHFMGGNPKNVWNAYEETETYYNYYQSNNPKNWHSKLHGYKKLISTNLYSGIKAEIDAEEDIYKYTYHVDANVDVSVLKMKIEGASMVMLSEGRLIIKTQYGQIIEEQPIAFQLDQDNIIPVECDFRLRNNVVSFHFPKGYDKSLPLVIDPKVIFASYSGSTADNWGFTATYDFKGNAYGGGTVYWQGYPTKTGSYIASFNISNLRRDTLVSEGLARDIGIMKLSSDGKRLLYATYLGGSYNEEPHSMVCDSKNELIVFGTTNSEDFPVTSNAYDTSANGLMDIFISKFSEDGSKLIGSTFYGGSASDGLNGIPYYNNIYKISVEYTIPLAHNYGDQFRGEVIVDSTGHIYVATTTQSNDFPVSTNAYQKTLKGKQNACVFKLSYDLSTMYWSTYIGDTSYNAAYSLQLDSKNNAYICGGSQSGYFFKDQKTYQNTSAGGSVDAFVCKLKNDGSEILEATFLGTSEYDQAYFVQLDKEENVYLFGQTEGTDFPVVNARYVNPKSRQFISKFNNTLDTLLLSTVFGSGAPKNDISPSAFLVDDCGKVYISGWGGNLNVYYGFQTDSSNTYGMPLTNNAYQKTTDGFDFYLAVFAKELDTLLYGSYFGGRTAEEHVDGGTSRFDKQGVIYQSVCGGCGGRSDFPTTDSAWSKTNKSSNCNNLVFKIDLETPDLIADFEIPEQVCTPIEIKPINKSLRGKSYFWDFGDGHTDTVANPTYVYPDSGLFKVTLVAKNLLSCSVTDTATQYIRVYKQADAQFSILKDSCSPKIKIEHKGIGSYYKWDFGDGITSNLEEPEHTYKQRGNYTVKLLLDSGSSCADSFSQNIYIGFVHANFIMNNDSCNPSLIFTNLSSGGDSYLWEFSNGIKSNLKNPTIKYIFGGKFTAKLTVMNKEGCSEIITKSFTLPELPYADFSSSIKKCTGEVQFNNISTGAKSYLWNLGDSTIVKAVSPKHIYKKPGTYKVMLVVNPETQCTDTIEKEIIISFPRVNFNFNVDTCLPIVQFYDHSEGNIQSYLWNFGNGNTSTEKNPVFNYNKEGNYEVQLIIQDSSGCSDTLEKSVIIYLDKRAYFNYEIDPCSWLASFKDSSRGAYAYFWDFGDGATSTQKNVGHIYKDSGRYVVTLIINPGNACADTFMNYVFVKSKPEAQFTYQMDSCTGGFNFINKSTQTQSYWWQIDDSLDFFTKDISYKFKWAGTHKVRLIIDSGTTCADTLVKQVAISDEFTTGFYVPNIFTPNDDHFNDVFEVKGTSICKTYELEIYNRWGELIYRTKGNKLIWDGKLMSNGKPVVEGVYYWVIKFSATDIARGTVTLIR